MRRSIKSGNLRRDPQWWQLVKNMEKIKEYEHFVKQKKMHFAMNQCHICELTQCYSHRRGSAEEKTRETSNTSALVAGVHLSFLCVRMRTCCMNVCVCLLKRADGQKL